MNENRAPKNIAKDKPYPSPVAGILSYLVPGLGQIYQGRIAKGVLFLICLYGLFFYGMYLGNWQNVYVFYRPPAQFEQRQTGRTQFFVFVTDRARFVAQAWIGMAAWPAVIQHFSFDANAAGHPLFGSFQRRPSEPELNRWLQNNDKHTDLGWIYTVIAGVLNILVIYDAYAGPVFIGRSKKSNGDKDEKADEKSSEEAGK